MNNYIGLSQMIMIAELIIVLMLLLAARKRGSLTYPMLINAIILMGCIMRIGYTAYTPCVLRGHDLSTFSADGYGKAGYILGVISTGKLPSSYTGELYQQPLYYLLGALCGKILLFFNKNASSYLVVNAASVISCSASCLSMYIAKLIFFELKITQRNTIYGMLIICFSPVFYLIGGRVGEDSLSALFVFSALLVTLIWRRSPSWKTTIVLALLYGFGMLVKISMAVPAVFTAIVFLIEIQRNGIRTLRKVLVFAIISIPLGLSYSIRNFILFGQEFTYVLEQPDYSPMYTGYLSYVRRFILPDLASLLKSPFASPTDDFNLFTYLLKSELFGEFSYEIWIGIPYVLLFLNFCLTVVCLVYSVIAISRFRIMKPSVSIWWLLLFVAFAAYSYLKYPFGCTMDCRYYVTIVLSKALILAQMLDVNDRHKCHDQHQHDEALILSRITRNGCVLFAVFSCIMFCFIKTSL
ncbi:MAG: hypothetical protein GX685_01525 [Clostridiales bacterium]|nr:hypothetical protein [Clostridiales bacterium]